MKKIKEISFIVLALVIILGFGIKTCTSKEVCDVATEKICQYESKCTSVIFDFIKNLL